MPETTMNFVLKITLAVVGIAALALAAYYGFTKEQDRARGEQVALDAREEETEAGTTTASAPSVSVPVSSPPAQEKGEKTAQPGAFPAPDLARPVKAFLPLAPSAEEDFKKRLALLIAALRRNPDDYSAWLGVGLYRKALGDYAGAAEVWEYVALRWPTDYVAYNNLGDLYHLYLKDYPKAEQYFLKTAELQPSFVQTYFNLYELYRYSYKGKENEAPRAFLLGLEKNPLELNLLIGLARHYADFKDRESGTLYYKTVIQRAETLGNAQKAASLRAEAEESGIEL